MHVHLKIAFAFAKEKRKKKFMILAFFSISCQIFQIRNEKARRYLSSMRKKKPVPFSQKFPNADPLALRLLERMLAFEPKDRPSAEEVAILLFYYVLCHSMCLVSFSLVLELSLKLRLR